MATFPAPPARPAPPPAAVDAANAIAASVSPSLAIYSAASFISGLVCAYHGYKREDTTWGAVKWWLFGSMIPGLAPAVAYAQGFGTPSEEHLEVLEARKARNQARALIAGAGT